MVKGGGPATAEKTTQLYTITLERTIGDGTYQIIVQSPKPFSSYTSTRGRGDPLKAFLRETGLDNLTMLQSAWKAGRVEIRNTDGTALDTSKKIMVALDLKQEEGATGGAIGYRFVGQKVAQR